MYDARPDRRGVSANICVRIRVLVQPGLNTSGRQSPLLACAVQWVLAARTLPGSAPISAQLGDRRHTDGELPGGLDPTGLPGQPPPAVSSSAPARP